jgi:two-component system LytT family sensor kinase
MIRPQPSAYREILIHTAAWLCYLGLQVLALDKFEYQYWDNLLSALAQLPAQLVFTYTTLYGLIPAFLLTRRYALFGLLTLVTLLLCGVLYWEGTYYLYMVPFAPDKLAQENPWDVSRFILCAFYLLCTSSLLIGFHLIRLSFRQQQENQALIIANQQIELKSLKDQINPHFLFNTLNNLYGLTSQDPPKAAEVVMRLGQLMQYMLYEGNLTQVLLRKEIEYVQNYVALERIRYGERLHLSLQLNGAIESVFIAPLILLPFVENAFKHGVSRQLDEAWIQMHLTVGPGELVFKVENSKPEGPDTESATGIGLPNIAKRLQLIYPGRHQLRQLNGAGTYLVTLKIELIPGDFSPVKPYETQVFAS